MNLSTHSSSELWSPRGDIVLSRMQGLADILSSQPLTTPRILAEPFTLPTWLSPLHCLGGNCTNVKQGWRQRKELEISISGEEMALNLLEFNFLGGP